ncbi:FtsX-like permease family protein [Rothia sp. SD9660Na]|uniref:ABC transporter permease n=1 Tax=Rothia sp. SD9660Na TaxID=3047030 RepID=UPI0024BA655D|nr:ABC transporter permease [Rothia sp. SD9660Na]WHS51206.1 FtsX-like permease family protein [Rothia sp. SD9660Na]
MATTLGTVAFSNLGKHRLRFALTSIGIAISAFFLTSVLLINTSFYDKVRQASGQKYSTADAVVETTDRFSEGDITNYHLSQEQADRIASLPMVESTWTLVATYSVIYLPAQGESEGGTYSIAQADIPTEAFFPYSLTEGSLPTSAYQIVITDRAAEALSVGVGGAVVLDDLSTITEQTDLMESLPQAAYTVTGIYERPAGYRAGPDMVFTPGTGVKTYIERSRTYWDSSDGIYEQVLLKLKDPASTSLAELKQALANSPSLTVSSVEEQIRNDVGKGVGRYTALLSILFGFGALSLLMSSFIIASTYKLHAAARSRELALLRTLGATRLAVVRMLLVEAAALGALSSLAGIITAYLAALVFNESGRITFNPLAGALAMLVCTLVTLAAVLKPVWATRAIPPVAALNGYQELPNAPRARHTWAYIVLCLVLTLATVVCALAGLQESHAGLIMLATVLAALTFVVAAPLLVAPGIALLRVFARPYSTAALAHSNIAQSRASASVTVRMVFICAAFVSAALTGYSTMQQSFMAELDRNYPYDVEAVLEEPDVARLQEIQRQVSQLDGVDAALVALPQGSVVTSSDSWFSTTVYSVDPETFTQLHGEQTGQKLTEQTVLLSQAYADSFGFQEGQQLYIEGTRDAVELIVSITPDTLRGFLITTQNGNLISGTDLVDPTGENTEAGLLLADFDPGISWGDRFSVLNPIAEITGLDAGEFSGVVTEKASVQDNMRSVLWAVLGLLSASLLVSLVGLANTQLLSTQQRRRSYALLRINGLSSRRLQAAVSYETLLLAVFALIWGAGAGLITALLLLQVFAVNNFALVYSVQAWHYLAVIAGGLALAWATVFFPARSASRIPPVAALQEVN